MTGLLARDNLTLFFAQFYPVHDALVVKRYNIKSFVHRLNRAFRQSQRRDMRRFMRNWDACPDVAAMFAELLRNRNLLTDT